MTEYVTYITYGDPVGELSSYLSNKYGVAKEDARRIVEEEYHDFHDAESRYQCVLRIVKRCKAISSSSTIATQHSSPNTLTLS